MVMYLALIGALCEIASQLQVVDARRLDRLERITRGPADPGGSPLLSREVVSKIARRRERQAGQPAGPNRGIEPRYGKRRFQQPAPQRQPVCQRPGIVVGARV